LNKRPVSNCELRSRRLAAGLTEGQVAEGVAKLVAAQTGRELAINGNYVSKLERGVITWPNRAYREAFRALFGAANDDELGFYPSRTRRDAERWEAMRARGKSGGDAVTLLRRQA
jgi:transcriptional regulator with XRE-family HTH domain